MLRGCGMHHAPSLEGVCWIYWAQGKWRCELRRMVREAVNLLYFFVYKATCIYSTLRACKGPAKRARRLLPQVNLPFTYRSPLKYPSSPSFVICAASHLSQVQYDREQVLSGRAGL